MAIGNQPNAAQLNAQAAQLAMSWRSLAQQTAALQAYVTGLGSAGLQAAPLSFSSGDASAFITACNYMATLAQVYQGTATQGSLFNFGNALVALTGPS